MTFVVRAARPSDLAAIYQIAKSTGGGFTNLPADRSALKTRLDRAAVAFARHGETVDDELFFFVLEDTATRKVRGTCLIFSRVGSTWPFYSYRLTNLSSYSQELDRTLRYEMLTLSTDLDGASEVGGLFLHPGERSAGVGALLARSRYLFIAVHRARFGDRTIAELRGTHDETGGSAFWDGLGARFFGMTFREADEFNAVRGNQFIADLMPKHPIYTALLPESARMVIGQPHNSGRAAMRMLEKEGFVYQSYVDIFDGGPTMVAPTDAIATVRNARSDTVIEIGSGEGEVESLIACGRLGTFRATAGASETIHGGVRVDETVARALEIAVGDTVVHVPR